MEIVASQYLISSASALSQRDLISQNPVMMSTSPVLSWQKGSKYLQPGYSNLLKPETETSFKDVLKIPLILGCMCAHAFRNIAVAATSVQIHLQIASV